MFLLFFAVVFLFDAMRAQEAGSGLTTADSPTLITSPRTCLSNLECPASQYCDTGLSGALSICLKRLGVGQRCDLGEDSCKDGLHCTLLRPAFERFCTRQAPPPELCDLTKVRPCSSNNTTCRRTDNQCGRETGFAGDKCRVDVIGECQQDRGFYCNSGEGACTRRKPTGAVCGLGGSNYDCEGFCATGSPTGTCAPTQEEGGLCLEDYHCKRLLFPPPRTDQLMCNIPRGRVGRCIRESRLIRVLGVACNPSFDRCDARRGLGCRWTASEKRFVCQQRAAPGDLRLLNYCTPGSPFSTCLPRTGIPVLCRQGSGLDIHGNAVVNYFSCQRRLQVVRPGRSCSTSYYSTCGANSTCERVEGVLLEKVYHGPSTPLRFCVHTVGIGASCSNKFYIKCAANLTCVAGRCVASSSSTPARVKNTHAGVNVDCSKLPCIPGAVCTKIEGPFAASAPSRCMLPTRIMKEGQHCFDTALAKRSCAAGLICAQNTKGYGLLVCRKPGQLDAVCVGDDACQGNLKCAPSGRCYDPNLALPLGASCNPRAGPNAKRCISGPVQDVDRVVQLESQCLPKGKGFACQIALPLFAQCDLRANINCADGAVCSSFSVCMPQS